MMTRSKYSLFSSIVMILIGLLHYSSRLEAACIGDGTTIPYRCTATAEATVGGVAVNDYLNTVTSDDVREVLTEQDETIGPPPRRCDFLDQRWTFELPPHSGSWRVVVEGHRGDAGSDGDDFRFLHSSDNTEFTPTSLLVNNAPVVDVIYTSEAFEAVTGTFYLKAADTDCSNGHRNNASLSIDHLYLESLDTPAPPPVGGSDVPIIGYYTNWSQYGRNFCINHIEGESDCSNGSISASSAEKITHIKYAFFNHDASGAIFSGDEFSDHNKAWGNEGTTCDSFPEELGKKGGLCQLKILKQNHPHIKTLLSIGGWTWSNHFSDIYADPAKRVAHCDSILWYLNNYGLDGIDIDWEYPGVQGEGDNVVRSCNSHEGDPIASPCDAENFREFVNYCGPILKAEDKLLTMALPCDPRKYNDYDSPPPGEDEGELDLNGMIANIDSIDLLSYDMKGGWSQVTGHHSGLYQNNAEGVNETFFNTYPESEFYGERCVQGYIDNGVPVSKLALGVPFYSRSWKGIEDVNKVLPEVPGLYNSHTGVPKGTWDGGQSGISGVFDYEDIVLNIEPGNTPVFDVEASSATLVWSLKGKNGKGFMSYVDPQGICDRVDYVKTLGLYGLMFWEMSGDLEDDDRSLIQTMYCGFNPSDTELCPMGNPCP